MPGKRKAETRRWFQQALYDLRAARWNIEGGFHDTACFLAQQVGEKALKSLLYYLGARRQALLTHSLVEMIEGAGKKSNQSWSCLKKAGVSISIISHRVIRTGFPAGIRISSMGKRCLRRLSTQPIESFPPFHSTTKPKAKAKSFPRTKESTMGLGLAHAL